MRRLTVAALASFVAGAGLAACVGAGEGSATGSALVPLCRIHQPVSPGAALQPRPMTWTLNYYAAERTGRMLQFRAQHGGAVAEYTDHLYFVIQDTDALAARIAASSETDATGARQLTINLGPGEPLVRAFLAFRWSCGRTKTTRLGQNVSLPAVSGTMVFRSVDTGYADPRRLTDVPSFTLTFADTRPVGDPAPTGFDPPILPSDPIGSATLTGSMRFVYDTAVPAQGFPGP